MADLVFKKYNPSSAFNDALRIWEIMLNKTEEMAHDYDGYILCDQLSNRAEEIVVSLQSETTEDKYDELKSIVDEFNTVYRRVKQEKASSDLTYDRMTKFENWLANPEKHEIFVEHYVTEKLKEQAESKTFLTPVPKSTYLDIGVWIGTVQCNSIFPNSLILSLSYAVPENLGLDKNIFTASNFVTDVLGKILGLELTVNLNAIPIQNQICHRLLFWLGEDIDFESIWSIDNYK